MSEKVNAKLYRIQDLIKPAGLNSGDFIYQIIKNYFKKSKNKFREVNLKPGLKTDSYSCKLFVFSTPKKIPEWYQFLTDIVNDEIELKNLDAKYTSFVLFIYYDDEIFVVTKGYHGHHLLDQYIDKFFGLEVLSRLVDKRVTEIKQIEERGVFGIEIGSQRYFRGNYNLSYEDDFGKIYKTMLASISDEKFEKIGITKKRPDVNKIAVYGSSSFEVSTNFDFDELINRINKIVILLETKGVEFNQFYRLSPIELSPIKTDLNSEILNLSYDAYIKKEPIDFSHPDVFNYLRSIEVRFNINGDYHEIPFGNSLSYLEVIDELINKNKIDNSNKDAFIKSLKSCYGAFKTDEVGVYSNDVRLEKWIGGEIEYKGQKYFKIDNDWYKYKESFNKYINKYFETFDFSQNVTKSLIDWNIEEKPAEGDYNLSYMNQDNFIIGDTALLNNIELCDLIRIESDKVFLYHIKGGLGRDLRVLLNQIVNASRILTYVKTEENDESLSKYYDSIHKKNYNNDKIRYSIKGKKIEITKAEFINEFKSKRIVFIFAYSSKSKKEIREEIIATDSLIAKLSLIYCIRDMKQFSFEFFIERIKEI